MNFVFLFFLFFIIFIALANYKKVYENFEQNTSNSFFRITKRKENKTLQYQPQQNKLCFDTKNKDFLDLWTFWDKQLYNLNYGIYLTFNKDTKILGFSKDKPKNSSWVMNDKGRLLYVDDATKKEYCVPIDTLNEKVIDKKCVDYGFYFEIINEPFKLKQGEIILIEERMEFPEKTSKNWKKNPPQNKKFENTNIKIYGDTQSYKLNVTKNDSNEISFNLNILKPTVLWLHVITNLKDLTDVKNLKINKKTTTSKNVEKNKKTCDDKSQIKTNFGIEYHKMYPEMVKKLTSKTAIEFGVQDPDSQKIYRCRDILTSPYYIKKFKCLF